MRPAWRLAISSLYGRGSRTALLVCAVALSAALVATVSALMASVKASVQLRMEKTVGVSDVTIRPSATGGFFDASLLEEVAAWPETTDAVGWREISVTVRGKFTVLQPPASSADSEREYAPIEVQYSSLVLASGLDFAAQARFLPVELLSGRLPQADDEVVIDALLAQRLTYEYQSSKQGLGSFGIAAKAETALTKQPVLPSGQITQQVAESYNEQVGIRVGDTLELLRFTGAASAFDRVGVDLADRLGLLDRLRRSTVLQVVGIAAQPPLGGRPQAFMTQQGLDALLGSTGQLSAIDLKLADSSIASALVTEKMSQLPETVLIKETARITSGVERNLASSQLGLILATILSFLTASFIILTGLTTDAAERERELAMLRCIGASRSHLAESQLMIGGLIGLLGAVFGLPMGLGLAWLVVALFPDNLPAGMQLPAIGTALTMIGAIGSGLAGAAYPAWRAASTSPLRALGARARRSRPRGILLLLAIGLGLLGVHLSALLIPTDGQTVFWGYVTIGLPAMFFGYFILGTPTVYAAARLCAPLMSKLLGLPPRVLERTVTSTPARYGLTAGAMMAGLSLMVSIWTQGGALMRDWLDKLSFADAFVHGINLPQEAQDAIDQLDFVERTCAITIQPVQTDAFGIEGLSEYATAMIAFEPNDFFAMTTLEFVQGDQQTAIAELEKGNALLVAQEFLLAQGLGVGDSFMLLPIGVDMELTEQQRQDHTFRIVGVVRSPGLEIVSKFFNVGDQYVQQSMHAVFGTRVDLARLFNNDSIQIIQIDLDDDVDDTQAMLDIRSMLSEAGVGILDAGSGRRILSEIESFIKGSLQAFTAIAVISMLIACFGVANVIVSSIQSRQFEFGVLRAVGAQRGLVLRLVVGEALLIGLAACVLGIGMGLQGALSGQRLNSLLFGLSYTITPPPLPIAIGCGFVITMCLLAAAPAILRLNGKKPRELLAAMKG